MRIDPQRLIRLRELIIQRNFRKAADSLNITQPALSQSIAQMEEEVGVRLIERTPHGVVPTAYGSALMDHAKEIEKQLSEAAKKIVELTLGRQEMLAIGGTTGGPVSILALAMCRLRKIAPDLNMRLLEDAGSHALLTGIENRSLDLAICRQVDSTGLRQIVVLPFFQATRCLCVRAGHPAANDMSLAALAKYPIICPPSELGIEPDLRRVFESLNIDFPENAMVESNSLAAVKEILLNSDAFAIISDLSVVVEARAGLLKLASIDGLPAKYWHYLVLREDQIVTDLLGNFISLLKQTCHELNIDIHRLFLIKGGQRHSLNLFLRRNTSNGVNADVPRRFYLRNPRCRD